MKLKIQNKLLDESGISLIEVIASIVILTIILISFLSIFPQMGLTNKYNDDKQDAFNLVQKELNYWKNTFEGINDFSSFLSNPVEKYTDIDSEGKVTEDSNSITIKRDSTKTSTSSFKEIINISKIPNLNSTPKKAVQIHVKLLNKNNSVISEIYGFIFYEG